MKIAIEGIETKKVDEEHVEIVERKGLGHPDTICDALSEEFSIALSNFYIEKFGRILHHNVDKALLVGGRALPTFGGGKMLEPIRFIIVGRVTTEFEGVKVPAEDLMKESAGRWINKNFRFLKPEEHILFELLIRPGSPDLTSLFKRGENIPLANDTSFGVGYAPLSKLENAVYNLEKHINGGDFKKNHPEVGEDVKVMGIRFGDKYYFTVSIAFNSILVSSLNDYVEKKSMVKKEIEDYLESTLEGKFSVIINAADDEEAEAVYITLTGTSAEGGDDGQVGRGNRANGLITPMRPMSLEALSGKNPVSHVGKLYNVVARDVAKRIIREIEEVEEAYVYLVSEIGSPITEPQLSLIKLRSKNNQIKPSIKEKAQYILKEELEKMPSLYKDFIERKLSLY